jgi:glycosyltransferase involved in cell wall biosynthesis
MSTSLRRIVLMIPDLSTLGGVQIRTAKTLRHAPGRACDYVGLSLQWEKEGAHVQDIASNVLVYQRDRDKVLHSLRQWSARDTVVVFPNNSLRGVDAELRAELDRFPLVFVGSGQLSYHLQDSVALVDTAYCQSLKVTKLIVLSKLDSMMYSQFGNYDTVVGFNPVETRSANSYDLATNKYVGYVGRLDFRTKGCDRLIDICRAVRDLGRGPLHVYTVTNPRNSPDFATFMSLVAEHGLSNDIHFVFDQTDLDTLFSSLQVLVLPSRKESFGNTILEANSFGVPVISSAYAPGPATLIDHDRTGLLLERFDHASMTSTLSALTPDRLAAMSREAFAKHRGYSMQHYFDHLETVSSEALASFSGQNLTKVYPTLEPVEWYRRTNENLSQKYEALQARHLAMRTRYAWIERTIVFRIARAVVVRVRPWLDPAVRRRLYRIASGQPRPQAPTPPAKTDLAAMGLPAQTH